MKLPKAFAIMAAVGLANVAHAQAQSPQASSLPQREMTSITSTPSLNAKWVSALVGMKVETPAGARLGTVKNVIVDGYGRATYAVIAYAGMMGLGNKYTAVPWLSIAEMLQRDRLLMDQGQLENAPVLPSAKPDPANRSWRREADSYWRGKVALGAGSASVPAEPNARAPVLQSETSPKERK
jgi:sporulation protein YlmC with PRC-barrel domain